MCACTLPTFSGRRALLLGSLILGCSLAFTQGHAAEAGWVATQTQSYLPQAGTPAAAGPKANAALLAAGRDAVPLPLTASKHLVLVLGTQPAPSEAQIQAVVDYLQQNGFAKIRVTRSHRLIEATGSVASIRSAFHTTLKGFRYQGREVFANEGAAQVPQALGSTVAAVLGLQDVAMARSFVEVGKPPTLPTGTPPSTLRVPLRWEWLGNLYDVSILAPGSTVEVAIVASGDLSRTLGDLHAAMDHIEGYATNIEVIRTDQGEYRDDPHNDLAWSAAGESLLAFARSPHKLTFYNPSDLSDANLMLALDRVEDDAIQNYSSPYGPQVILLPFGMWEGDAHRTGFMQSFDSLVSYEFHIEPPLYIAPTGDDGAYAQSQGIIQNAQGQWLVDPSDYSVNFPASSPYVHAIGGTAVYVNWLDSPSGPYYVWESVRYAWESAWNSGLAPVDPNDPSSDRQLHASGGGISKFEMAIVPNGNHAQRTIPDLSFDADPKSGYYLIQKGVPAAQQIIVGGTGVAAGIYAGLAARMAGNPNFSPKKIHPKMLVPAIAQIDEYDKENNTNFSREDVLHPVNYGSNGYAGYGYKAGVGYDGASGWGSINTVQAMRMLGGR